MWDDGGETRFADRSEAEWQRLAEKALAGAGLETLASRTDDGIAYGPLYPRRKSATPIATGSAGGGWMIAQRVDDPDPARAKMQALVDLEAGAEALSLCFDGAAASHGFGLPLTEEALQTALEDVLLDIVHIRIEPHRRGREALAALTAVAARQGLPLAALSLDAGIDAIGPLALAGTFPDDDRALRDEIGDLAASLARDGFAGRVAEADGRIYHEAGASEAQELGATLATAVWHLRALEEAGLTIDAAAGVLGFTLAADQQQLLVTAKLRAMRLLWRRVLQMSGITAPAPTRLHVETSYRMMTARDPHANILRTTIAAFAAATGGADSVSILPFTSSNGLADERARRLARNTQLILREESGLGRVADPAAGSGGIEALTDALAEAGWAEFRRIESEGGIFESLRGGRLQARIAATRAARDADIAAKRQVIVGVTLYPLDRELAVPVLIARHEPTEIAAEARVSGDVGATGAAIGALRPHRLAQAAETIA